MSIESAKAFVERMKTDEDFSQKVISSKDSTDRKAIVVGEGFSFTDDELNTLRSELSDEELDAVAGGSLRKFICAIRHNNF